MLGTLAGYELPHSKHAKRAGYKQIYICIIFTGYKLMEIYSICQEIALQNI